MIATIEQISTGHLLCSDGGLCESVRVSGQVAIEGIRSRFPSLICDANHVVLSG